MPSTAVCLRSLLPAAFALIALLAAKPAFADDVEEAKTRYKKGLAAFALGRYPEAAVEYEAAFALRPDPALLYNAAQAHRLGGNKQRAYFLYQNYLKLFGKEIHNRDEVEKHIASLK